MTTRQKEFDKEIHNQRARLVALCALILVAGLVFGAVAGPPRAPARLPQLSDLLALLGGSVLPLDSVLTLLVDCAWLVWAWIVWSLLLELAIVGLDALAHGAAWVRSLRSVADRLSAPLIRRAVAGAFAVQVLSRGVPLAAAQTLTPAETTELVGRDLQQTPPTAASEQTAASPTPTYLVRPGDTLWSIAERAYGSGTEYRRILHANVGRRMDDGKTFSARGVIQPGWDLVLPDATWGIEQVDGERWYTVRPGDSLSRIAGYVLGDASRWNELLDVNRGAETPDGRQSLEDPNVIWPGLRLKLPGSAPDGEADTEPEAVTEPEVEAQPGPEPAPTDLVVASAPPQPTPAIPVPTSVDPPPLLRSSHAVDPIVLEPADRSNGSASDATATPVPNAAAADADVTIPSTSVHAEIPTVPLAIGGAGLAAIAGLAFGARRMRRLRPLPHAPENEIEVHGGFAEAQLTHDLTRGLHGVGFDPVDALVGQVQNFLREYNLTEVTVVSVRHGRSSTTIALRCGLAEQPLLVDLAPAFAERLEAEAEAWISADQDVLIRLTKLRKTRLLLSAESPHKRESPVPLGVLYDRQVLSVAPNALGNVLVVSLPGHGADTILTSLVATLTARRSPDQLRLWLIAPPRAFQAPLYDLPHVGRVIDPADGAAVESGMDDLRRELDARAAQQSDLELAVVVSELTSLGEHAASLALLACNTIGLGVRLIAACTSAQEATNSPLIGCFGTRMVLRTQSEETSVAMLGVADAAFLGGGGRLLLRLDGREALELYGYQVSSEHLERLVKVMRSAYPATSDRPAEPPHPGSAESQQPEIDAAGAQASIQGTDDEGPTEPASTEVEPESDDWIDAVRSGTLLERPKAAIHVICFGGPRVFCRGDQIWPARQSGDIKPWEFLLFLACQPAEGVSRHAAVNALWPDDEDPEDVPHRFRQLRYRLRNLLKAVPGGPDRDGVSFDRGIFRLDPAVVYSDAQEFLNLVRSVRSKPGPDAIERLERARALYLGDLLEGPDARRYAWANERDESGVTLREHFRHQFQQASVRLAELYAEGGALGGAVDVYRELTEIDPADEALWQALFRVHAQRRDRVALIHEEHRMREALRELADQYDADAADEAQLAEPSLETVEEFQRLLANLGDREPASV